MPVRESPCIYIHAPNVHSGGGLNLLHSLLSIEPSAFSWAQLDARAKHKIPLSINHFFVKRSFISRLLAEWRLRRKCNRQDIVFCFHGLPPLLPLKGKTVVFLQNRLLFDKTYTRNFPWPQKVRIFIERLWLNQLYKNASRFVVQSSSMLQLARKALGPNIPISIFPFYAGTPINYSEFQPELQSDFLYIASGDPHKNHARLLDAWVHLSKEGIKPTLFLTVDAAYYPNLAQQIETYKTSFDLNITNLGHILPEKVGQYYQYSKALIYPSLAESFGLPLLEASQHKLPILAAEKDYVRDLIHPIETFDPESSTSIARAVKRFLKLEHKREQVRTASELISELSS